MVPTRRCARSSSLQGFSLVELSIVVAILSVVVTMGLEAAANFINKTATATSRERLAVVDDALDKYFKRFGRLPCPTSYTGQPVNFIYGQENCSLGTKIFLPSSPSPGGGLIYGAVPYGTLNIAPTYALDGFGSQLNYVVTINLTQGGGDTVQLNHFNSSGSTIDKNGTGGIEVRTGELAQPCNASNCQVLADPTTSPPSGAAYFVFSSGADQRGARSVMGTALKACAVYSPESRVDTQNCVFGNNSTNVSSGMSVTTIPVNVFYDNRYNNGFNLKSYFDDVTIWRTKAQL